MTSMEALHIDMKAAVREDKPLKFTLSDDFFEGLEQDEILGGALDVTLKASEVAGEIFKLRVHAEGKVRVQCDRCLDEMEVDVDTEDTLTIHPEADDAASGDDIRLLQPGTYVYDVAWDIYEQVVLSLPIQRTHEEGQCNAEMLHRLEGLRPASAFETEN